MPIETAPTRPSSEPDAAASIARLLHGCVRLTAEGAGWLRPWRFTEGQVRAMGSCQAWHPGLLRQMARCTAGICLEFDTDATEVRLAVRLDAEPKGSSAVLDGMDDPSRRWSSDDISADVDGRHVSGLVPDGDVVTLPLEDLSAHGVQTALPGFGENHSVRIWLPCLRGCVLRELSGNGSYLRPTPERGQLLVLGDSVAQGFIAGDPASAWPHVLAGRLGLDVVNQSLGGQVFQPGILQGLSAVVSPELIVVALGENYRYEPCRGRSVARDIGAFLAELARAWPGVETYVLTPTWHDESRSPSHERSCWREVPGLIAEAAAGHGQMRVADGARLMDASAACLADGDGHPSAQGAAQVAERLHLLMTWRDSDPEELRQRALKLLARSARRAFPLVEAARRGIGRFVLVEKGCVLFDAGDDQLLLFAPDHDRGRAVLLALCDSYALGLLEPGLLGAARDAGYGGAQPHHLAVYRHAEPPEVDGDRDIRVLDESFLDAVLTTYSHPEFTDEEELRESLRAGKLLGGFEDGQLVGYMGEHAEGSMGMLEVLEPYRRRGWGSALESAKIAQVMRQGHVPWVEVLAGNEVSLALQRKLGMTIGPANEQCYLFREHEPLAPGVVAACRG